MELTENDLNYLRNILGHLYEFRGAVLTFSEDLYSPKGRQLLTNNIEWLDDFIRKHEKDGAPL